MDFVSEHPRQVGDGGKREKQGGRRESDEKRRRGNGGRAKRKRKFSGQTNGIFQGLTILVPGIIISAREN